MGRNAGHYRPVAFVRRHPITLSWILLMVAAALWRGGLVG